MTTSTRDVLPVLAAAIATGGACLLAGCRQERSATTEEPGVVAPDTATVGAPPVINATEGSGEVDPSAATFEVAGMAFSRPEGWALSAPGPMRAAELRHPGVPDGAIIFTHFGERGAGTVPDNLTRWARQVTSDNGEPTLPEVTEATADVGGVSRKITFARYEGTYASGMPSGPAQSMPGTLFLGAVIERDTGGPVYMRAFGPKDALAPHVDAIFAMLLPPNAERAE